MFNKIITLSICFCISCSIATDKRINQNSTRDLYIDNNNIKFRFFYRDEGSINEYYTNSDLLVIEQFNETKVHISDLIDIAIRYRDTATSEFPLSRVDFLYERPSEHHDLKQARVYDFYDHMLLSVSFENILEKNKDKKKPPIFKLVIWNGNTLSKKITGSSIDSLISKNPRIDSLWNSFDLN